MRPRLRPKRMSRDAPAREERALRRLRSAALAWARALNPNTGDALSGDVDMDALDGRLFNAAEKLQREVDGTK